MRAGQTSGVTPTLFAWSLWPGCRPVSQLTGCLPPLQRKTVPTSGILTQARPPRSSKSLLRKVSPWWKAGRVGESDHCHRLLSQKTIWHERRPCLGWKGARPGPDASEPRPPHPPGAQHPGGHPELPSSGLGSACKDAVPGRRHTCRRNASSHEAEGDRGRPQRRETEQVLRTPALVFRAGGSADTLRDPAVTPRESGEQGRGAGRGVQEKGAQEHVRRVGPSRKHIGTCAKDPGTGCELARWL